MGPGYFSLLFGNINSQGHFYGKNMVKLSKYNEDEFSEYLIETINVKPNQESMGVKRTALLCKKVETVN